MNHIQRTPRFVIAPIILVLQWTPQRLHHYSMNNELTESSLLILNIVSASRLATLN